MKVLLLTTCICNENNIKDLKRLILSINQVDKVYFEHLVLLQNASNYCDKELLKLATKYNLIILREHNIISLSKARNILIAEANNLKLTDKCVFVSLPDDDCWYPKSFWNNFLELEKREAFDLFYTQFSSHPLEKLCDNNEHTTSNLIRNASSNTTFYSSIVFKNTGIFNEEFGVGAKNNGGEDLDFAIRASLISKNIYYSNCHAIGHRDPLPEFRYKYFQGSFGILKKYKFKSLSLFFNFIRKFAVGCVFYIQGQIELSDFKVKASI